MFDKAFFQKHRKILLFLANNWIGRKILCIDKNAPEIRRIDPNGYFWGMDDGSIGFDIRTHNKYSKRLYHAFYYVWATFHWLDMNLINNYQPKWNLGFDSFGPIYPAAGTGGPTGNAHFTKTGAEATFSSLRDATTSTTVDNTTGNLAVSIKSDSNTDRYDTLQRYIATFDTSIIDDDATVDSAILSLDGVFIADNIGVQGVDISGATPAADFNFVVADYDNIDRTSYSNIDFSALTTVYNDFTLNASGISNISLTGNSKFSVQTSADLSNTAPPSWVANQDNTFLFSSSNTTGTANDPKLAGTFSLAVLSNALFFANNF